MKKNWKYIALLTACIFIAYGTNAQWRYHPYNRYNNRFYNHNQPQKNYNQPQQNQYQTYSNAAQRPLLLSLNYSFAGPTGTLHDYIHNTSPRGWKVKGIYEINDHFGAGLTVGFNDFYKKIPRQIYHDKGGDISAVQTRSLQVIPILATGIYTFSSANNFLKPYVGIGVGVNNISYSKYWGEFGDKNNKWNFAVSPQAGIRIPFGKKTSSGINVGVMYNYSPYSFNEIKNLGYWEANAGIYFHIK